MDGYFTNFRLPAPFYNGPMPKSDTERATFAGGCFWCMEPPYDGVPGIRSVMPGYTGGQKPDPTYEEVCEGDTGHAEAVEIEFDPKKIPYTKLLEIFWRNIDPTMVNGQFADRGTQYRTAIFYHSEEQRQAAEASKRNLAESGKFPKPIATEIVPATVFYPAEEYHQKYYQKCPLRYDAYKKGSGRQSFIERTWGKS
jgi:peptide methionine sulfoxide reductase msrA/msrB